MTNHPLRIVALASAALFLSAQAEGQRRRPAPVRPIAEVPLPDTVRVDIKTADGSILVDLDAKHAPVTVRNFVRYVDQRRFDGTAFYRAMKLDWGTQPSGLVQGGTQNDPAKILTPIVHEPTSQTGILHKAWTISMARFAPGTATGDFSILLSDMPSLDADPKAPGDNLGYAAFGHVVGGEDVVRKIFAAPRSATLGEGVMKGEMLDPKVRILTVRRVPIPVAPAAGAAAPMAPMAPALPPSPPPVVAPRP